MRTKTTFFEKKIQKHIAHSVFGRFSELKEETTDLFSFRKHVSEVSVIVYDTIICYGVISNMQKH